MSMFIGSCLMPCHNNEVLEHGQYFIPLFAAIEWYFMEQMVSHGALANVPGNYYVIISIRTFLTALLKYP